MKHNPKEQKNHLQKGDANHQRQRNHQKKKMSDWSDEDTNDVVDGRGFGTNKDIYKTNNDDYQNDYGAGASGDACNTEENDNGYGNKKRYNSEGRRGGRGTGRGGGVVMK